MVAYVVSVGYVLPIKMWNSLNFYISVDRLGLKFWE